MQPACFEIDSLDHVNLLVLIELTRFAKNPLSILFHHHLGQVSKWLDNISLCITTWEEFDEWTLSQVAEYQGIAKFVADSQSPHEDSTSIKLILERIII